MAVPKYHLTDAGGTGTFDPGSGIYEDIVFGPGVPGSLLMDADAWFISPASTMVLTGTGAWTVTINGKVTSSTFAGGGNAGIYVQSIGRSSITVGAIGAVGGFHQGIVSDPNASVDITNKGHIYAQSAIDGRGIYEQDGTYTIENSGSIESAFIGIDLSGAGTHTIVNSGSIIAPTAIKTASVTTITNSGTIEGDLSFGGKAVLNNGGVIAGDIGFSSNADTFTNFIKVTVKGKLVIHNGSLDSFIDLGAGNDTFKGGANAETLKDGQGADTYKLGGGNDILFAAHDTGSDGIDAIDGGAGRDTYDASAYDGVGGLSINLDTKAHGGIAANSVIVSGQTDHIFNFEDVVGSQSSDFIYGNASANHIVGGDGADVIFGLGGNDILSGGFGCYLEGDAGNDRLSGGLGSSDLYGGAGADILTGGDIEGTGNPQDFFRYKALSDSGVTPATRDEITNFRPGHAFIDLSEIDAIPKTKGVNDDFHFIDQSQWGKHAGELRYVWTADQTIVEADVNGDGKADFSIALDGHLTLAVGDFIGAF